MIPSLASPRRGAAPALPTLAALLALLVALALVPQVASPRTAHAGGDAAAELTSLVNAERSAAGLPALQGASDLVEVATRHAGRMASSNDLHHNPNLAHEVSNWERLTENVGRGPAARVIHDAFMASSTHAANILDPDVTQLGVGVVWTGDTLWVTQIFRRPQTSQPPPPPESTTAPAAPEPEPAPAAPAAPTTAPPAPMSAPDPVAPAAPSSSPADVIVGTADAGAVRLAPATVLVDTADVGVVRPAPSPEAARLLTTARTALLVWLLVD